jgi:hypothetical protein
MTDAEFQAEVDRRLRAMDAAGLPQCQWLPSAGRLSPKELLSHLESCPACKARSEYERQHFGPLPARTAFQRVLNAIFALPDWLQPPAFGALGIGAIVAVRVLLAAVTGGMRIDLALAALGLGMAGGAAGGLVFSATRPIFNKLGTVGDYLTGIVATAAYMGSFLVMFSLLPGGKPIIEDQRDAVIYAIVTLGFGLFMGHLWHRNRVSS